MSSASNWLFNFLVAEITPIAFTNIGWKYYLVFVCTNSLSVVMWYLFAPENRNRSLEDIDGIWLNAKNPINAVKVAKELPQGYAEEHDISAKGEDGAEGVEKV